MKKLYKLSIDSALIGMAERNMNKQMFAPTKGKWVGPVGRDPITRLASFPDFHSQFPIAFRNQLRIGCSTGIAIGDVDGLKGFVEDKKNCHPYLFGHLAGNWFMNRLGSVALEWFASWDVPYGILSTFGGDEIIIAASGMSKYEFGDAIKLLSKRLCIRLPRTVSFACGWFTTDGDHTEEVPKDFYIQALVMIDRALFTLKHLQQREGMSSLVMLPTQVLTSNGWFPIDTKMYSPDIE